MKPMVASYLLAGVVVAALLWQRVSGRARERLEPTLWHLLAWPFFVPALLAAREQDAGDPLELARDPIAEMEGRLLKATDALARQLGQPLGLEIARVRALATAMRASSSRAEALERVLFQPGFDAAALEDQLQGLRRGLGGGGTDLAGSFDARLAHVRRVRELWERARADLQLALARAAELEGRLTLLRFEASRPAAAAAERAHKTTLTIDELAGLLAELKEG